MICKVFSLHFVRYMQFKFTLCLFNIKNNQPVFHGLLDIFITEIYYF